MNEKDKQPVDVEALLAHEFFKHAPVSMWACNRDFQIVLWNPGSEVIYGHTKDDVIGKNYLELFVDPPEREQSRRDCLKVIDSGWTQHNCLANDLDENGKTRSMLTNVFRIQDHRTGEYLQAEIGVEISDLGNREVEHRSLREIGIAKIASTQQPIKLAKESLIQQVDKILLDIALNFKSKQRECIDWRTRLERSGVEGAVSTAEHEVKKIRSAYQAEKKSLEQLRSRVEKAMSFDEFDAIRSELKNFSERFADLDLTREDM